MIDDLRPTRSLALAALVLTAAVVGVAAGAGTAIATTDASTTTLDTAAQSSGEETVTANYSVTYRAPENREGVLVDVTFENPEVHDETNTWFYVETSQSRYHVEREGDFTEDSEDSWEPKAGVEAASMTLFVDIGDSRRSLPSYNSSYDVVDGSTTYGILDGVPDLAFNTFDHQVHAEVSVSRTFGAGTFRDTDYETSFVGQHTNYTAPSDHGEITLVVPDGVDVPAGPQNVVDGLAELSAAQDLGNRYDDVVVYVAPAHDGAAGTAHLGAGRFWVVADSGIEGTASAWGHEFMHATDPVSEAGLESDLEWFTEGYASWYATQTPLAAAHDGTSGGVIDSVNYPAFQSALDKGRSSDANLTVPSEWEDLPDGHRNDGANYDQGLLAIGGIDRQIRLATDGEASFGDVVERLAAEDAPVGHSDLLDAIESVSGDSTLRTRADAWITGEQYPETPSAREYTSAYGYGVPVVSENGVTAHGTSGNESIELQADASSAADVGEPVVVEVTVSNDGTGTGRFEESLTVDGEVVDTETVSVAPQSTATLRLEHQFTTVDRYDLEAASEEFDVVAVAPGSTFVQEDGSTTASNPAELEDGSELAVLTAGAVGSVTLEQVDGEHSVEAETGDDYELATLDSSELEVGAEYEVQIPKGGNLDPDTQYVSVVTDAAPPSVEIAGAPDEHVVEFSFTADADVTRGDGNVTSYQWSMGDGRTVDHFYVAHGYAEPGDYTIELTVTDEYGQTATDTHVVDVYARPPSVQITAPAEVSAGDSFATVANETLGDGDIVSYDWSLGDGTTASGENVTHSYDAAGTYDVELTITDEYGHEATDATEIDVTADDGSDGGPTQTLVVDDFEDATAWETNENALGHWTGGGEQVDVSGGVLSASYQDDSWFSTKVAEDVSEYSELAIVIRGADGDEGSDVELAVGNTRGTLSELSGDSVGTEYSTVTVDFADLEFDEGAPGELRLMTEWGSQGTYEIEEIRFQ